MMTKKQSKEKGESIMIESVEAFIKSVLKEEGDTLQDAAELIGLRSRQALQDKLSKGNLKATEERTLAESYDCRVVWQKDHCRNLTDKAFDAEQEKRIEELIVLLTHRQALYEKVHKDQPENQSDLLDQLERLNLINQRTISLWGRIVGAYQARYDASYALTLIMDAEEAVNAKTNAGLHYGSYLSL